MATTDGLFNRATKTDLLPKLDITEAISKSSAAKRISSAHQGNEDGRKSGNIVIVQKLILHIEDSYLDVK